MGNRAGSSLGEVLAWLDRHINLEAIEAGKAGRAALPTLERIAALCSAMGDPQSSYPIIHITGTNGKGSTTRIVSSLLHAAGLSVGTLTSPHLERMNERIALNLEPISDDELAALLLALRDLEEFVMTSGRLELRPTWFELVTVAAYRTFADHAVDCGVIEVGLGGRYDATNVAHADVAVLTNVELDHVDILGPTRSHIAAEKSGIVKEDSVVIVGDRDPSIVDIFEAQARSVRAASLWRRDIEFGCESNRLAIGGRVLTLRTPAGYYEDLFLPLHGAHQADNASVALAAVESFFGGPLSEEVVIDGLGQVSVPGRLEVMGRQPLVVLDGAHNAAGATVLGAALEDDFAAAERIILIMGCLKKREPRDLLAPLVSSRLAEVVACAPPSPRALPAEAIADAARALKVPVSIAPDVSVAIARARELASERDLILVAGSLYLVGAARSALARVGSGAL